MAVIWTEKLSVLRNVLIVKDNCLLLTYLMDVPFDCVDSVCCVVHTNIFVPSQMMYTAHNYQNGNVWRAVDITLVIQEGDVN